jgi:hypothetical protein
MRTLVIALMALVPAACAHQREEVRQIHHQPSQGVQVERVVEVEKLVEVPAEPAAKPLPRPVESYERIARFGKRAAPGGEMLTIPVPESGMKYLDLFELVARETGVRIRYEQQNVVIKAKRVSIVGEVKVPKDDLLAWFQDVCAYDGLAARPYGPPDRRELAVLDQVNAKLTSNPRFVTEDELPDLAGRCGEYVACVLTLPEGVDAPRVRQALSQYSTKTAGLGRINDAADAGVLIVGDFASIVATMRRVLDEMAIQRYEAQQRR